MSRELPLVSIVTPTYNQAEYLVETVESVLAQDYPNLEYIVLDDGSTDSTPEVLDMYRKRITVERHENMGQVRTLNKGWERCKGEIIGYLSSDDLLLPNAVSRLVNSLIDNPEVVCIFPDSDLIDNSSHVIKRNVCRPFDLEDTIIRQECYIGPGALFRRAAFDALGGWRSEYRLAPDREFWIRISKIGRIEMCGDVLARYRMHPRSISYKDVSEDVSREYVTFLDEYFSGVGVPSNIAKRKNEAYGFAHFLMARNSFRGGRLRRGFALYRQACEFNPSLNQIKYKTQLIRNVVSRPIRRFLSTARTLILPAS